MRWFVVRWRPYGGCADGDGDENEQHGSESQCENFEAVHSQPQGEGQHEQSTGQKLGPFGPGIHVCPPLRSTTKRALLLRRTNHAWVVRKTLADELQFPRNGQRKTAPGSYP